MEVEGKLVEVLPVQSGTGRNGEWRKQDFVIETTDRFPKKICITVWSDMVDELANYKTDDLLHVDIDLSSREYNGRWYTDVKAWRMRTLEGGGGAEGQSAPPPVPPMPEEPESIGDEDDLPF